MVDFAVDLRDVAKTYRRRVEALRGIQMQVRTGEVFGLLGSNGAGKSTLVKIMMTVIRPNRAEGTILGRPIGHKGTLARVGYLPEHLRFPAYLTGRQTLEFFAAMSKVSRPVRKQRAMELLDLVGLKNWANAKVGTYSKGMRQRVGLAQALANDPDLLVLDPVGRREVREVLGRLRDQGKTIFLNSHMLSEVERICDRVAILASGRVIRQGTLAELTAGSEHFEIQLHGQLNADMHEAMRAVLACELTPGVAASSVAAASGPSSILPRETGKLATGEAVEIDGNILRVSSGDPERIQPMIDGLRSRGQVILSVQRLTQSLEDYFVQTVSDSPSQGKGAGR
jgi:ABC-2 type transport system ATP-binding protein